MHKRKTPLPAKWSWFLKPNSMTCFLGMQTFPLGVNTHFPEPVVSSDVGIFIVLLQLWEYWSLLASVIDFHSAPVFLKPMQSGLWNTCPIKSLRSGAATVVLILLSTDPFGSFLWKMTSFSLVFFFLSCNVIFKASLLEKQTESPPRRLDQQGTPKCSLFYIWTSLLPWG